MTRTSPPPAPLAPSPVRVSRNAGAFRGSVSAWRPPQAMSLDQQAGERALSQARAEDLVANDWAANSGINTIATNAVGTGLRPQSRINAKRLGITRDAALALQNDIEAVWADWARQAHVRGMLHFEDMQLLGLRTMLRLGEMLHLPVQLDVPGRRIQHALQDVHPARLRTPADKRADPSIVDGVQLGSYGAPEWYWLATPQASISSSVGFSDLSSAQFTRIPARIGHRPGCFHLFRHVEDEQVRGESILSAGMPLFRHLSDSLDNELLAQVVTASMAMFISRDEGAQLPGYVREETDGEAPNYYQTVEPGTILYGNKNEKPHLLESAKPSPNFSAFYEFVLRAQAASLGTTYEELARDFSKVNYSSARAALLESWRIYMMYRTWLVRHYCHPNFAMVIEEAWLSGMLQLPAGAPDLYDAMPLYTNATWIGPQRGYIDPVKEVASTAKALENHLMTYSEALAERGRDFEEVVAEREEEERILSSLRRAAAPPAPEVSPPGTASGAASGTAPGTSPGTAPGTGPGAAFGTGQKEQGNVPR
ncbi:phage portal protein [Megalodesulfovibrio paquesii]